MGLSFKLQTLRKKCIFSQEELAEKLNVSRQSVSKWEAGLSNPEIEKIVMLSDLFHVPTDYLLKDVPEDAGGAQNVKSGKNEINKKMTILLYVFFAILLICIFALGRLSIQNKKLADDIADQSLDVTPETENIILDEYEQLGRYYFDFSRENRFDYVPFFTEGNAPTESPEYLFWAFAINLDNWGEDKGIMSKSYVDEMVAAHFNVTGISHLSMRKAWDYHEEKYTAMPQSIKEKPLYILKQYSTSIQNGIQIYEVVLGHCALANGMIPEEEDIEKIKNNIADGLSDDLVFVQTEKFTYYQSFNGPVFLSHGLVEANSAA